MDNEKFRKSVQRYIGEPNNLTIEGTATPNSAIGYTFVGTLDEEMSVTADSDGKFVIPVEDYKYTYGFKFTNTKKLKSITKFPIGIGVMYAGAFAGEDPSFPDTLNEFRFGYIPSNDINIIDASSMFMYVNFNGSNDLDLISSVKNATAMFYGASGQISGAFSIKYYGDMADCFTDCTDLINVQFTNTITPTSIDRLFNGCTSLKSVNFVNKDENGNVLNHVDFSVCKSISFAFTNDSLASPEFDIKIGSMPGLGAYKDTKQMTLDLTQACTSATELSFDCSEFADCSEFNGNTVSTYASFIDPDIYFRALALHKNQYNLFKDTDEYNKLLAKGWMITST